MLVPSWSFNKKISLFIGLLIISTWIDKHLHTCKKLWGKILIFIHHIIAILHLVTPFIFGYYLIHFILSILFIAGWFYFNGCILKIYHHNVCGVKSNDWNFILSIFIKTIFTNKHDFLGYIIIHVLILCYDIYYITKIYDLKAFFSDFKLIKKDPLIINKTTIILK